MTKAAKHFNALKCYRAPQVPPKVQTGGSSATEGSQARTAGTIGGPQMNAFNHDMTTLYLQAD